MKRTYLFIVIFFPVVVMAQPDAASSAEEKGDSSYFYKLDTLITIKLSINNDSEKFNISGGDFVYDISPNVTYFNRINFNYKFVSFRYDFVLRAVPGNKDNNEKGKTRAFSLELNAFMKHWNQELQFSKVRGFYLNNTSDFVPGWSEGADPYIVFPDLKVMTFRGTTSYKFNPRFSLKAIRNQTEMQLKSAGSWVAALSYSYLIIDNKSSSNNQQSSQRSENIDVLLSAGYSYNFVFRTHWYLNVGLAPGYGMNFTRLTTRFPEGNNYSNYSDPVFRIKEDIEIGYNSMRFFAGLELFMAQTSRSEHGTAVNISFTRSTVQVFAGYRFNSPGFFKKFIGGVEGLFSSKDKDQRIGSLLHQADRALLPDINQKSVNKN